MKNASEYVEQSDTVVNMTNELIKKGIKTKDAAHLACAIYTKCDYFITTDDKILKYNDSRIHIISPIDFIIKEGE